MSNTECFTDPRFVSVALTLPIGGRSELIYRVPDSLIARVQKGVRVIVPVSSRKIIGIIVGLENQSMGIDHKKVKDILDVIDEVPIFPQYMRDVWEWVAQYYFSSPGAALQTILPRTVRQQSAMFVTLPKKKRRGKKATAEEDERSTDDDLKKKLLIGRLRENEKGLLTYVTEKKRVSVRTLQRRFPQLALREALQHLESLNLIRMAESFPRPRTIHESYGSSMEQ